MKERRTHRYCFRRLLHLKLVTCSKCLSREYACLTARKEGNHCRSETGHREDPSEIKILEIMQGSPAMALIILIIIATSLIHR